MNSYHTRVSQNDQYRKIDLNKALVVVHLVIIEGISLPYILSFHTNFAFWKFDVSERNQAIYRKIDYFKFEGAQPLYTNNISVTYHSETPCSEDQFVILATFNKSVCELIEATATYMCSIV